MNNSKKEKYSILNSENYSFKNYTLVPLRYDDIFKIKQWRNEQLNILRQNKILTDIEQENYYQELIDKSFFNPNPNEILFSFLLDGKCIGYGGVVYIDWKNKSAEISFINETKRSAETQTYHNDFTTFITILFKITFSELLFNKLTTETYGIRKNTLQILDNLGFHLKKIDEKKILINDKLYNSFHHEYLKKFYTMV